MRLTELVLLYVASVGVSYGLYARAYRLDGRARHAPMPYSPAWIASVALEEFVRITVILLLPAVNLLVGLRYLERVRREAYEAATRDRPCGRAGDRESGLRPAAAPLRRRRGGRGGGRGGPGEGPAQG